MFHRNIIIFVFLFVLLLSPISDTHFVSVCFLLVFWFSLCFRILLSNKLFKAQYFIVFFVCPLNVAPLHSTTLKIFCSYFKQTHFKLVTFFLGFCLKLLEGDDWFLLFDYWLLLAFWNPHLSTYFQLFCAIQSIHQKKKKDFLWCSASFMSIGNHPFVVLVGYESWDRQMLDCSCWAKCKEVNVDKCSWSLDSARWSLRTNKMCVCRASLLLLSSF